MLASSSDLLSLEKSGPIDKTPVPPPLYSEDDDEKTMLAPMSKVYGQTQSDQIEAGKKSDDKNSGSPDYDILSKPDQQKAGDDGDDGIEDSEEAEGIKPELTDDSSSEAKGPEEISHSHLRSTDSISESGIHDEGEQTTVMTDIDEQDTGLKVNTGQTKDAEKN